MGTAWVAAFVLAAAFSLAARRAGALSASGAAAAAAVGTLVAASGRVSWAAVLLFFFLSASALTALPGGRSRDAGGRNARQVVANGGVAAVAAVLHLAGVPWAAGAFCGALGAACADTWATEVGVRYGGPPRRLFGGSASVGDSGAVSAVGTAAGVAGAVAVGFLAAAFEMAPLGAVALAGVSGMLADSALGATAQATFRCPSCAAQGEARRCGCGQQRVACAGIRWVDNDAVNLAATSCGGLVAVLLS
ncbi:MAG: DUF92 domain-containing protein [Armatimonadota bacterium]|nr:DUF92 domain-containing protein [Armatimonadota bacterium]